jgi:NAD(P)H dehydrogenase (quinone)
VPQTKILITGATGYTGRYTTEILIKEGFSVRAFVHRQDERSEKLRLAGAEIMVGDMLNLNHVRGALEGVNAAYFVYPIDPGLIDATAYFVQAAREADVAAVVNMSQISARRESKSDAARDHWISERVFDWSGVPVTHLRPTFFAQWLLYPRTLATIADHGGFRLPFAKGRHAPIAAEDQARLIAAILTNPVPHCGKTYPLCGPVEMNYFEIASTISEILGRPITYQPITIDEYRQELEQLSVSPFRVQHLCAVALDCQDGIFAGTDAIIEGVTGKPPMTVQAFVASHKEAFSTMSRSKE